MENHFFKNVVEKLTFIFHSDKINSPTYKSTQTTKIENKTEVNAQNLQIINHGLSYDQAKDLITNVVDQKLISFENEAKQIYKERQDEFIKLLTEKIKELPEEAMSKLKEPDTQIALLEAARISGRKQNSELTILLSNLVLNRIKNDTTGKEELKNIVFNEAISTVNKLTIDQLKIITLCYLLKYTISNRVVTWDTLNDYLNIAIKPFLAFKNTNTEFRHIEYAGCGSISLAGIDLLLVFKLNYGFLFSNLIPKQDIDILSIPQDVKGEVIVLESEESKYFFDIRNEEELKKYLETKTKDTVLTSKIISIYVSNVMNNNMIREKLILNTDIGAKLIDLYEKTEIKQLSLTSVGMAIAATYYEQIVGVKVDIDLWIN
jgi:hypothetical protein